MRDAWLLDVLADLTRFAEDNDLSDLARHLEDARASVAENEARPARKTGNAVRPDLSLGAVRRVH